MINLVIVVFCVLGVSFICSLLEAIIFSVRRPYIQSLIDRKARSGRMLLKFKDKIEEPISAIITLNTIAHTIGAAISGAMALRIFGSKWVALFSGVLTFLVLVCSEIIPKTIGAHYWKSLGPFAAYLLQGMIIVMKPILIPLHYLTGLIARGESSEGMSKTDIVNSIRLGYRKGVIHPSEFRIMENLFQLRSIKVKEVMTPRTVVFWLAPDTVIGDLVQSHDQLQFSRIPLYDVQEDTVVGVVLRHDIMNQIAQQETKLEVKDLARPPDFVPENMSVFKLLNQLIMKKTHLAMVLNEYGDFIGVVAMEDAVETLLGREIVDEFDPAVDMRSLARSKNPRVVKDDKG